MQIFDQAKTRHIPKGTLLLQQGEICNFGCKVISGCLKSYVVDALGKEHIMQFAPEGWLITDMESLLNRTPAHCMIEAIEDSEVMWFQGDTVDVWQDASREELLVQIGLLTRNIITANKRTRLLLSASAEQRYLDFIETYPTLAQRLPLKLIAAYLGITPEYLSEVRRKVAGK